MAAEKHAVNDADCQSLELRVLVLAPTARDAELTHAILARVGIVCLASIDAVQVCQLLSAGAGAVLIAEEAVHGGNGCLAEWLGRQPPWSDLPVLMLARTGADSVAVAQAMDELGNLTVLERPARGAVLVSAVRAALRARQRQYQLRDQLVQRERVAEQLDMAMAAAHAGTWQINLSTGEFSASDRAIELHGLPPGTPLSHERALACVHPDDRAHTEAALQLTFESGQPFRHEHRVPLPDGSVRWVSAHAERRGQAGQTWVIGLVQDMTDRKVAELALRASERLFFTLAAAAPVGIFRADAAGDLIFVNQVWQDLFGMSAKVARDQGWAVALHSDDRATVVEQWNRAVRNREVFNAEYRIVGPSGDVRWVMCRAVPDGDGSAVTGYVGSITDITARKQAEAEQESAQRTLTTVIEQCPFGIYMVDEEFRILSVNAQSQDAAFVNVRPLIGRPLDEVLRILWPEPVATDCINIFRHTMATGEPYFSKDFLEARADSDQTESYEWQVHRIVLSSGRQGAVCYYFDATRLRQSEAEVRGGVQRMRLATDATGVGIWQWNIATGEIQWDAQMFGIYGVTPTPNGCVRYDTWSGAVLPEDRPGQEELLQDMVRQRSRSSREFRIRRASDGECRVVAGVETVRMNAAGQVEWVLGTNLDITDRKRAEEALRASEARLGGILRQSPAGIVQTDAAGCMTMVNPRWCELLGHTEAELLGRNIIEITDPSFVAPTAAAFGRLAAGGPDFQIEKAYCRKDGSVLCAQSNVAAIRSPAGEFLGLIAVVVDISERLRSEEELRRLATQLSEADRRKDVFLATLAHELRNPLAPIRSGLQVMKVKRNDAEVVEQVRAMMDRQLTLLVRLVDDLLDLSRFTQGKMELRKEPVSLIAVIDAALEISRSAIEQAGHELAVVVPDEPIFVNADATRLAQIVSNLLNNSAKYTHRGGHVRLAAGREGGMAVLSVKDNGIGIPPAMIGRVFEMFTQVDRTLEKTTGGLGIGLSLVKGLLEMHGGTIEARSDGEGRGSEFVVRLPVVMSDAGPARPNGQTSETVPPVRRRILVVDDNVDAADSLGQLLEMLGNEVRTANDGEAGIAVAAQFRPDMVLMDIAMPKLNGYEAARRMREHPWCQGMVLVALTGWGQENDRKRSADAGFDHHLIKPVEIGALTKLMSGLRLAHVDDRGATTVGPPGDASPLRVDRPR